MPTVDLLWYSTVHTWRQFCMQSHGGSIRAENGFGHYDNHGLIAVSMGVQCATSQWFLLVWSKYIWEQKMITP